MTSDTPYRTLKGPFLNFLIREFLSNKTPINVLDVNLIAFLTQRYNNLNFFSFTDYIGNILPINVDIMKSFTAFGVDDITHAYPPTERELEELQSMVDLSKLPKLLTLIEYVRSSIEPDKELKEELENTLDNYYDDLLDNNVKLKLNPLPNGLNYTDLLFYRNYMLTNRFDIDRSLITSISLILGNYHIDIDSVCDVLADDKTVFYAKLNSKKIIKDKNLELEIHKDLNIIDFYRVVDPLLGLSSEIITKALLYISQLERVLVKFRYTYNN